MYGGHQQGDCDPDCTKGRRRSKRHEFIGPVKIVFVEPDPCQYTMNRFGASFLGLAYLLIGYTVISILLYTVWMATEKADERRYGNLHIVFCTLGFQLILPMSIMIVNPVNGPSTKLTKLHRNIDHLFGGCTCLILIICGVFFALSEPEYYKFDLKVRDKVLAKSYHGIFGLMAFSFVLLSGIAGPFAYRYCQKFRMLEHFKKIHSCLGCLGFLCSSICFLLSLYYHLTLYVWWAPWSDLRYINMGFCVTYTLIVIIRPIKILFSAED